jgi:pimeloyl-ACP methyl ester carboxylesterase
MGADADLDPRLEDAHTERRNRMTGEGDDDGATSSPNPLAQLLEGIPVTERRADFAGVSTQLLEGGNGPPIVLLHGLGGFGAEWGRVIPDLVGSHRVVIPDLPGHGRSGVPASRLDAAAVIEWLRDLVVRTCAEPPTLVGHSLGGGIAARFAAEHSDQIRQIVLVDSTSLGLFRPALGVMVAIMRFGARPSPESHDRFLRQVMVDPERAGTGWGTRWRALEAYDIALADQPSVSAAVDHLARRVAARRISRDKLETIGVPVSLIWGRGDRLMRFKIAKRASARFGWPLYPIDECGHGPHIERPDAFVEALRDALGRDRSV